MDSTQRARNGLSSNQFQFTRTVREDDGEEGRKNTMASSSAEMTPKPMTDMLSRHRRQQQPKPQITNTIQQYNVYNSQTNEQNCSLKMPNLTPIRVIGNGAFGYVFEAMDNNRGCRVALKRTQKAGNIISREFEILDMLKGKDNVVQLLDFFYSVDDKQRIIQNTVLEFCDTSLEDVLRELEKNRDFLPMQTIKHYARQIFNGLKSMHDLGICHRDLKPENVLLKNDEVRICDVGSSKILDTKEPFMNTPYVVSRYYRAPELILAINKYDTSIDIWAAGCIIFELLTRTPLFPGDAEGLQLVEMQQVLGPPSDSDFVKLEREFKIDRNVYNLFRNMTRMEQNTKIDFFKMLKCTPAFQKLKIYSEQDLKEAAQLIEKCIKWIPNNRISTSDALDEPFCKNTTKQ